MKRAAIYGKAEVSQGSIHGPVVVQGAYCVLFEIAVVEISLNEQKHI